MAKATNGSLTISVHSAGSLFKHPEIKRAVRQGTAPIGEILESLASNEAPVYGLDSVPFLTTGYDSAKKLYAAQKPYLEKQLAKEGLMLLYSVPWPPQGLYAKKEIKSVADLKGMKFRTYNAMIGRIAALAGAIPTQIEVPDLPTAFATGRVDVMITSASTGVDTKAQDYLTHYIDTQAWQPRNIVFVNKAAFDKLSAAEKKAVLDAAKIAEERGWKASIEEMTVKTAALKAAGIMVMPPSPSSRPASPRSAPPSPPNGRKPPVPTAPPCWRRTGSDAVTSPRARGEVARRREARASRVRGRSGMSEQIDSAPHPDPLPASGEREKSDA